MMHNICFLAVVAGLCFALLVGAWRRWNQEPMSTNRHMDKVLKGGTR